jgi:hypothetical protein
VPTLGQQTLPILFHALMALLEIVIVATFLLMHLAFAAATTSSKRSVYVILLIAPCLIH